MANIQIKAIYIYYSKSFSMVSIPISSNNNVLSTFRIAKPFTWSSRRVEVLVVMLKNFVKGLAFCSSFSHYPDGYFLEEMIVTFSAN
jgi:type 1 glutamine amidotransferase